jgi:hypothetical protein
MNELVSIRTQRFNAAAFGNNVSLQHLSRFTKGKINIIGSGNSVIMLPRQLAWQVYRLSDRQKVILSTQNRNITFLPK